MPNIFVSNNSSDPGALLEEDGSSFTSFRIMSHRQNSSKGHKNLVLGTGNRDNPAMSPEFSPFFEGSSSSDPFDFILPTTSSRFSVGKKASSASAHSSGSRGKGKGKEKEKEKDKDKDKKKTRSLSNLHSISPQGTININQ